MHGPSLRERIDLAFIAFGRADRLAIVVIRAAIPRAVPTGGIQSFGEPLSVIGVARDSRFVAALGTNRQHSLQDIVDKEPEPNALAFALTGRRG